MKPGTKRFLTSVMIYGGNIAAGAIRNDDYRLTGAVGYSLINTSDYFIGSNFATRLLKFSGTIVYGVSSLSDMAFLAQGHASSLVDLLLDGSMTYKLFKATRGEYAKGENTKDKPTILGDLSTAAKYVSTAAKYVSTAAKYVKSKFKQYKDGDSNKSDKKNLPKKRMLIVEHGNDGKIKILDIKDLN